MSRGVALWCALGGLTVPSSPSQEQDVVDFVEKCAKHGVTKLFPSALMPDSFPRFNNLEDDYGGPVFTISDLYAQWNPLAVMARAAHQRGIEVHPYLALGRNGGGVEVAWSLDYVRPGADQEEVQRILTDHRPISSRHSVTTTVTTFANDHREFWKRDRQGRSSFHVASNVFISPAFPEVRGYEVDSFLKILEGSQADGTQIEFVLEPTDVNGVIVYGYEAPALAAFQEKHGHSPIEVPNDDHAWMQFRADYVTTFIRELRSKLNERVPRAALTATIIAKNRTDYLKTFQDWPAWIEQGLLNGLYLWFRTTTDLEAVARHTREAADLIQGRCPLIAQLSCYHPGSFQSPQLLLEAAHRAKDNGADALGVYRAHSVEQLGLWPVVEQLALL